MTSKITVLLLAANPFAHEPLRLDQEARAIHEAIRLGNERDALDFRTAWAVRAADLQRALQEHKPHVVHFAGHASVRDGIYLEGDDGLPRAVSREALEGLFRVFSPWVRLVVLNACHSQSMIAAFREIIDHSIGMQRAISDEASILFSSGLYGALASGMSVKDAFDLGVNRLLIEGSAESATPVYYARSGVVDSVPFAVLEKAMSEPDSTQDISIAALRTKAAEFVGALMDGASASTHAPAVKQKIDVKEIDAGSVSFIAAKHVDARHKE